MSLNISASSIADYLACSQKVKFRLSSPEQQEQTPEMLAGTIVHELIEKHADWDIAYSAMEVKIKQYNLDRSMEARVIKSVDNYFEYFQQFTTKEDVIEYKFKIKHQDDILFVGKFDRITPDGKIFDWKTSAVCPKDISNNVQFIFYYECYKRLYGKEPTSVFYAHLLSKKLVRYIPNLILTNYLFNEIIPNMITSLKTNKFFRTGLYSNICKNCAFQQHCFEEIGYGLASRKFAEE